jgi:hypothetical protein
MELVALTSEVTTLKDHNLKLANDANPHRTRNLGIMPRELVKERNPARM